MKTTNHQIVAVLLALALILTLAGCSSGGGGDTATPPASEETQGTTPEPADTPEETPGDTDAPQTSDTSAEGLPDKLEGLAIMLDSDAITLPMPLEDFFALGWEPLDGYENADLEKTLEPKQCVNFVIKKDGSYGTIAATNLLDDQAITVQQSAVTLFEAHLNHKLYDANNIAFELPHGIKLGVSLKDDVFAAYGEPDDLDDDKGSFTFRKEDYRITFYWDLNSEIITFLSSGIGSAAFEYVGTI